MIEKHYSLLHMDKVLKLARKFAKGVKMPFHLDVWSNGREQGYYLVRTEGAVVAMWPALVFAQQRNSEQTMVVFGTADQFDSTTHMPSEGLWEEEGRRKHFDYKDDEGAAKFIVEYLAYYPMRELAREMSTTTG